MKRFVLNNWSFLIIFVLIIISLCFLGIYQDNIVIPIHDNLDSNVVWAKMMSDNNLFWSNHGILPFLGGIDRIYFPSWLKLYSIIYAIFPTFWAFCIIWYLKIILSVLGFVFLGKVINKNYDENKHIFILCGFLYGLTPTFPASALGFATLPLLLAGLVKYYSKEYKSYLPFFLLYPLLSDFSLFGIFIIGFLTCFIIIDKIKYKKAKLLIPLMLLILGYVISEWNIFYLMLMSPEVTIRSEFVPAYTNLFDTIKSVFEAFVFGHYHSGSLHTYVVLPVCAVYFVYILFKEKTKAFANPFTWLCILILFNSIIFGLDNFEIFKTSVEKLLPPLKGFGFARTLWFNPFLWYLAFAIALCNIFKKYGLRYLTILLAFLVFLYAPSTYNFIKDNVTYVRYQKKHKYFAPMTYSQFYSTKLFEKIKNDINYNGEWSIAFGMHPAILEYNGISTLDGYLSYYSLNYKRRFRDLIKPELDIDSNFAKYFDNWGARAYIFSKDITFQPEKNFYLGPVSMNINPSVFSSMGGVYVFSRTQIENFNSLNLAFVKAYESDLYKIFVYKQNAMNR